ncbi:formimidoyltransferase-cyclodeaminase-like [Oppia nitens]|uniref:formimidoyltransferase-cyclodeaminase-like n=1 Tax=Oppia nitens TaxID=1686743 RepID=UPI0023DB6BD5|nr:formimidoyltransferase-cyclodeaminase-like [Oppia nitens]
MNKQIVECVPNFSEGRDTKIIEAIASAIRTTDGVTLLDVDPGQSTNRTVYTFVGSPDAVVNGALNGAKVAYDLIDMSKQKGEHPRLGALDVCPFIPVRGVDMDDCVRCAQQFAKRLSDELNVAVYLYGYASNLDYRKTVPQIRSGEYEGLPQKLTSPEWVPDYGPNEFVAQWGATMSGARKFLIAYNVNMISTKEQAHRIALLIREKGSEKEETNRLKATQAMGWWLNEANIAQVTVNILDHEITPIHAVYEAVVKHSNNLKLPVTGSQMVGLVPLKAILDVAEYYMKMEDLFILDEDQKVHLAITRLGLNSLGPFDPKERIIEYMLKNDNTCPLINKSVKEFVQLVGDRITAPGGGSVAANVGSLGIALAAMVAKMSYGKKMFEHNDAIMRRLIPPINLSINEMLSLVDTDTNAYNDYVLALKLPQTTPEELKQRENAIEMGLKGAIAVPLRLARISSKHWDSLKELAHIIHYPTKSDLQVGANCLKVGILGAYYNVMTNISDIKDENYKTTITNEIENYKLLAERSCNQVLDILDKRSA